MGIFDFLFPKKKKRRALAKTKADLRSQANAKGLTLYRYDKKANHLSVASVFDVDEEPDNIVYLNALNHKNALRKLSKMGY